MKNLKSQQKTAFSGGIFLLVLAACWYATGSRAIPLLPGHFLYQAGNLTLISGLVCLLAALHAWMTAAAEQEREEEAEAEQTSRLFENELNAFGRRQQALTQFNRWVVPFILATMSALEVGLAVWVFRGQAQVNFPLVPAQRGFFLATASLGAAAAFLTFIYGKYCAGLAFRGGQVFLRSLSGALLLASGSAAVVCGISLLAYWGRIGACPVATRLGGGVAVLLAVERLVAWVMELYRPSARRGQGAPGYESRILGVFTQPRGVAGNLADLIDYQFGIRLSEGALRLAVVRGGIPFLTLQVLSLAAMSCLVYIPSWECGVEERWGRDTLRQLEPGLYVRPPWPISRITRVPVKRIRQLRLGAVVAPKASDKKGNIVPLQWDDERFSKKMLLTVQSTHSGASNAALAVVGVVVDYRISDPIAYVREHRDPEALLQVLGQRALASFLATHDFSRLYLNGGKGLAKALQNEIQAAARAQQLKISVVTVGIEQLQPPPEIAAAYRQVLAARELSRRLKTAAESYAVQAKAQGEQEAHRLIAQASGETARTTQMAKAETYNFTHQLQVFRRYPQLYTVRARMDALERWLKDARKVIVASKSRHKVINLQLKKAQPDFLSSFENAE